MPSKPTPIPDSVWLSDGFLLGTQPARTNTTLAPEDSDALIAAGFDTICYIEFARELLDTFDGDQLESLMSGTSLDLEFWFVRFDANGVPPMSMVQRVVTAIDNLIGKHGKIYLHGTSNPSHTAVVAAFWLIQHGSRHGEAIEYLRCFYGERIFNNAQLLSLHTGKLP